MLHHQINTPLGLIDLVTEGNAVRALEFHTHQARLQKLLNRYYGQVDLTLATTPHDAAKRLEAYFAGDLQAISAINVATNGTPFQTQVWQTLRQIPAGQPWTYGQLAKTIGRENAYRAVGTANGANAISIIIPCHRVVAVGHLGGYGGGLDRKKWLLDHEQTWAGSH